MMIIVIFILIIVSVKICKINVFNKCFVLILIVFKMLICDIF